MLLCSDAMYVGLDILRPHLPETSSEDKVKAVIGVVEGDTHDIGKNLVKIMMETAGFEMIDLGRDVPLQKFVDTAIENHADIVCMSTLMTTTMGGMETVINLLKEAGIRDQVKVMIGGGPISQKFADKIGADSYTVKVMIGGGPISQKFADKIGADSYTANAVEAVKAAKEMLNIA